MSILPVFCVAILALSSGGRNEAIGGQFSGNNGSM